MGKVEIKGFQLNNLSLMVNGYQYDLDAVHNEIAINTDIEDEEEYNTLIDNFNDNITDIEEAYCNKWNEPVSIVPMKKDYSNVDKSSMRIYQATKIEEVK